MSFNNQQLTLPIQLQDDATFDNFYIGDNALVLRQLRRQLTVNSVDEAHSSDESKVEVPRYIFLHGGSGSGRSHLLQAACHCAGEMNLGAAYLPLKELKQYSAEDIFTGLEHLALVCIDDFDQVVGDESWENELFHLFNRLADSEVKLVVAANCSVRELPLALSDLASRLSWGEIYQLRSLNPEQQLAALQLRAARRGLDLGDDVGRYIQQHCQRDTSGLLTVLDKLDADSMVQKRRLTIPFVKLAMGW